MNRRIPLNLKSGFSMIELIMVLIVLGIMGAISVPIFAPVIQGTVDGTLEQNSAEESYWAIARLTSLASRAIDVQIPSSNTIELLIVNEDESTNQWIISHSDAQLSLNAEPFWTNIVSFSASYTDHLINIDLQLKDVNHPTLSLDIFPRPTVPN